MLYGIAMSQDSNPLPAPRARLAAVLRASKQVVSVDSTAKALALDRRTAAKLLSRWRQQGWLRRVGHGLYVSVPIDMAGSEQVLEDPWVLVPTLFDPAYIGGWTAAHHWELTEQLFNETVVFTTRRITRQGVTSQGARFLLRRVPTDRMFGLVTLWRGSTRVAISDAPRTLIDMLVMPETGGGIDHVADCVRAYLDTPKHSRERLIDYAEKFGNGAIFKRLGFLAEERLGDQKLAVACRSRLTQGYTRLDPALSCTRLVTAWRLWIPPRWKRVLG